MRFIFCLIMLFCLTSNPFVDRIICTGTGNIPGQLYKFYVPENCSYLRYKGSDIIYQIFDLRLNIIPGDIIYEK